MQWFPNNCGPGIKSHLSLNEGTFVTSGFRDSMIDPMVYGVILNQGDDFKGLMELREMMEVGMLRLAMRKHTEDGMVLLRGKLNAMEALTQAEGDVVSAFFTVDNEFHDAVSALCDNEQAEKINRVVRVLTHAVRYETVKKMKSCADGIRKNWIFLYATPTFWTHRPREPLIESARADSERFCLRVWYEKCRKTVYISHFSH